MSAVAAPATMPTAFIDGSVVDAPVLPPRRDGLRLLSGEGQPGSGGLDDALRLGRSMRLRLRAAVLALLADPSIAGLKDAPKLAAVVLYAKSRAPRGREDDNQSSIWGAELGRWLGVTESTVHHKVLPPLRGSDGLHTRVVTDAKGHPTGLDCLIMPLWRARKRGGSTDPLALSKAELAVLLRLIEALFGPGWTPKDREPVPAGLLAGRTGKGAATDRLGLLLMVLSTRASGWLQLCGGSVRKKEGRGAATLSRLLGCSPSGARKVLARLTAAGVVARERKATVTRMNGRGRVMLLPIARAYGRVLVPVEDSQAPEAGFSQRPDGAVGDHAPGQGADALGASGVCGAKAAQGAGNPERPDDAELHADHASGVTHGSYPQVSGGFPGEGGGGEDRRPERVCARENQVVDGEDAPAESVLPVAEVGPLRGEKPGESAVDEQSGQRPARIQAGDRPEAVGRGKTRQQGRVDLPDDLGVRVALGPVSWLWAGLSNWQQDRVVAAVEAELKRLKNLLMYSEGAPRLLADRLTDRLEEVGGEARVTSPFGWITRRGLVQRQACSDGRCDDGIRLDTGGDCENCGNVIHIRRARRARVAAGVDRELPGLGVAERRQVVEDRMREHAAAEAEDFVWRREQARAEQARRETARAAARERAELERQEEAAADAVRQALSCVGCGQQRSAGLCEACGYRRRTEAAITEAELVVATWAADPTDQGDVAAVATHVRATLDAGIEVALQQFLELMEPGELEADPVAAASVLAFNALQAVQQALPEYRSSALGQLGNTPEADAEARRAYKTEQKRRWFRHNPNGADAIAAATKAADAARERTAEYLLATRLEQLRARRTDRTATAVPAPWSARLAGLAARPLNGVQSGAVIA
ncbi:hypothetical protein [Streptomyces fuscichromogenes]|uniref:Uncharacterized protein n=1 Tax=Streptomyces fuscichromogenes TaxID=1324013 RepID=A0A917XNP2_9ACTN|nr:hypothetical protein [Streptomyces fuscichromogenes]GGN41192.1 hypothetical protein GCM10011578_089190 [Streptomyces fuscichromogenes]